MYHLRQHLSLSTRLPYGRLISRILEQTNMDLNREPAIRTKVSLNEINSLTITRKTGIIRSDDNSYRYQDSEPAAPSTFPIPEGGITNEFLYLTVMNQHRETTRAINSLRQLVLDSRAIHGGNNVVDEEGTEDVEEEVEESE